MVSKKKKNTMIFVSFNDLKTITQGILLNISMGHCYDDVNANEGYDCCCCCLNNHAQQIH